MEMSCPQLSRTVARDHPGFHLEVDSTSRHLGIRDFDVVHLDHELGKRFDPHHPIDMMEHQLDPATIEEHELTRVHRNTEPHLLGPEFHGFL